MTLNDLEDDNCSCTVQCDMFVCHKMTILPDTETQ